MLQLINYSKLNYKSYKLRWKLLTQNKYIIQNLFIMLLF